MTKTRREIAAPIIDDVIERIGTDDMPKLRKALREAFPWGVREYHPYKIWLDEIRIQLGDKPRFNWRYKPDANQRRLF